MSIDALLTFGGDRVASARHTAEPIHALAEESPEYEAAVVSKRKKLSRGATDSYAVAALTRESLFRRRRDGFGQSKRWVAALGRVTADGSPGDIRGRSWHETSWSLSE